MLGIVVVFVFAMCADRDIVAAALSLLQPSLRRPRCCKHPKQELSPPTASSRPPSREMDASVKAVIQAHLDAVTASGEGRVEAWDSVQKVLLDAKLAWHAVVPPDQVGIHPANRSSLGVGAHEAHKLGARILKAGFSLKKTADSTAFELPPRRWTRPPGTSTTGLCSCPRAKSLR